VPVISSRQLLTWLDGRNSSSFTALSWAGNTLSFNVTVRTGGTGLQVMVPRISTVGTLRAITYNGAPQTYRIETIKGIEYTFFTVASGSYQVSYGASSQASRLATEVDQYQIALPVIIKKLSY
jgi:hypothetical protein